MDLIFDQAVVAKAFEVFAERTIANDQQVGVVANHFEQIGRPDHVFHALLVPQPADGADQVDTAGQPQLVAKFIARAEKKA